MSGYGYEIILDEAMKVVNYPLWGNAVDYPSWFDEPGERPPEFRYLTDRRPTPVHPIRKYETMCQAEFRPDERYEALRDRLHVYYGSVSFQGNTSFTVCDELCEWLQGKGYTLDEFKEARRNVLREREKELV